MYPYEKMLVGMNLTDHDRVLVRHACLIAGLTGTEEITFVHVTGDPDIPEEILEKYPGLPAAASEAATETLEEITQDEIPPELKVKAVCMVRSGQQVEVLFSEIRDRDIDLVVLGKKTQQADPGILAEKIARKAPCSVLVLPDGNEPRLGSIAVAMDFSGNSADALDEGIALAAKAGISEIKCIHVYKVPLGFSSTGETFEEFAQAMAKNAERQFEKIEQKKKGSGVKLSPVLLLGEHPSKAIGEWVEKEPPDLLIVGARGRSAGAAVLLGSVTERLIKLTHCPLLAVKRKGAGMGVLKALLEL